MSRGGCYIEDTWHRTMKEVQQYIVKIIIIYHFLVIFYTRVGKHINKNMLYQKSKNQRKKAKTQKTLVKVLQLTLTNKRGK